ncbi:ATP synthase mitochondrial F1 complex assembly factor 1 [Angomonas deanei]|uniref:ATP11 protein, putative n=1 Tax=Angomonas deanei TaxID=59799 RepID=A0A7G2CAH1_9TRYP|nr:ATP synthase mitochondrial F1 complex assembly factor 1 [Angomonas deanei]CAD2216860.1 ATP11 protein, putative [Angomonas deanei]|eukprot:EPY32583.1 ATP synthase mitochondrial F1 complex assembly factor 1 [Angomonas deanei]
MFHISHFLRQPRGGYFRKPGRKGLDEIVKLPLFESATPHQVASIWSTHHTQFLQYWGRVISAKAYNALEPRLRLCPYFVVPCFRDKGLFNVVTNFKDDLIGVAPLGEWQQKQDAAQIHMTIQFFTELQRSKQLVLVRCEIKDEVFKRTDCIFLTQMILKYYTFPRLYETYVETFNKRPNQFDYHAYLRAIKDDAQRDDIRIEDKKTSLRYDDYGPIIDTPPDAVAQKIMSTLETGPKSTTS